MSGDLLFDKTSDFGINYLNTTLENSPDLEQYHDSCEIAFFRRANISIFYNGKQYRINDGDILFIKEYEIHKIVYTSNTTYERYVIFFRKSYVGQVLQSLDLDGLVGSIEKNPVRKASLNLKQRDDFERLLKELLQENSKSSENDGKRAALTKLKLVQLLMGLDDIFSRYQIPDTMDKPDKQVQDIVSYIDGNYMNHISLELLGKKFFLSKYHMLHVFKKVTGLTVVEYLQLRRIIEAQNLLKESGKSVTEICYACGFNNIQHFCRVFRKLSKTSPVKYRKMSAG